MKIVVGRASALAIVLLLAMVSVAGVASAQTSPECYPVPPGGCEDVGDDVPTCDELIADLEGDQELIVDANEDGVIDSADLPEECQEASSGVAESVEVAQATEEPTEEAAEEPTEEPAATVEDDAAEEPETAVAADELAMTGIESGPLALVAMLALFGGVLLLVRTRKRA